MLPSLTYCIVRDSAELKELIDFKIKQKGLSTYKLAQDLQMDYSNIKKWRKGEKRLKQWDMLRIAKYLGIQVSLKLEIID